MPVQTVIKHRRDLAANWTTTNPILNAGEIGFEADTGKFKIGNGTQNWVALKYAGGGGIEVSETAPTSPNQGALWFNSTNGITYIRYDSYWIEQSPAITGPAGPAGAAGATGATGATGPAGSAANTDELYALTLMGAI
jgi:hypothetical protein